MQMWFLSSSDRFLFHMLRAVLLILYPMYPPAEKPVLELREIDPRVELTEMMMGARSPKPSTRGRSACVTRCGPRVLVSKCSLMSEKKGC